MDLLHLKSVAYDLIALHENGSREQLVAAIRSSYNLPDIFDVRRNATDDELREVIWDHLTDVNKQIMQLSGDASLAIDLDDVDGVKDEAPAIEPAQKIEHVAEPAAPVASGILEPTPVTDNPLDDIDLEREL